MGQPELPLLDIFGDAEMATIFSADALVAAWLEVERALAEVQASLGLIPSSAAAAIAREASADGAVAWAAIRADARTVGYPILPLIQRLAERSSPEVGAYLHWGATTQDIMDTGLVLQVRDGLDLIAAHLDHLGGAIATRAVEHRRTVMPARTHAQQAVPTTFGAKLAVWLDELRRHRDRLSAARERVLVVQLFGAGGTAAALGPQSRAVRTGLARVLGLGDIDVPWHTARDSLAELGFVLAATSSTAGKIGREVVELSRSEIAEVREAGGHMRGASSTMPQKANPILSEAIVGMSALAAQLVPALLVAMQAGHERSAGEWQIEWDALPSLFALCGGAIRNAAEVVEGLQVYPDRMRANLELDGGLVMAEAVMIALAPILGRDSAHDLVYRLSSEAREEHRAFKDVLLRELGPALRAQLPPLDELLQPDGYLGEAEAIVEAAVAGWSRQQSPDAGPEVGTTTPGYARPRMAAQKP